MQAKWVITAPAPPNLPHASATQPAMTNLMRRCAGRPALKMGVRAPSCFRLSFATAAALRMRYVRSGPPPPGAGGGFRQSL